MDKNFKLGEIDMSSPELIEQYKYAWKFAVNVTSVFGNFHDIFGPQESLGHDLGFCLCHTA